MLRPISTLKGLTVGALDGDIGSVYDVYFDSKQWTVRYFVVDTGTWLSGRRVLVSPMALRTARGRGRRSAERRPQQGPDRTRAQLGHGQARVAAARDRLLRGTTTTPTTGRARPAGGPRGIP